MEFEEEKVHLFGFENVHRVIFNRYVFKCIFTVIIINQIYFFFEMIANFDHLLSFIILDNVKILSFLLANCIDKLIDIFLMLRVQVKNISYIHKAASYTLSEPIRCFGSHISFSYYLFWFELYVLKKYFVVEIGLLKGSLCFLKHYCCE